MRGALPLARIIPSDLTRLALSGVHEPESEGHVLFDTVRRFKGQQDPAIILTDVDPNPDRLQQDLSVLFCGMTRATARLEVVCNAANRWVADRLLPAANA